MLSGTMACAGIYSTLFANLLVRLNESNMYVIYGHFHIYYLK